MPVDASIPLGIKPVEPMQSLSNVVNVASGVQGFRNAQLANQRGQQDLQQGAMNLQERQGVQGVLKNIKQYQDEQGNIDWNRLTPDIMQVAPTTGSDVIRNVFGAQQQATQAKSAVLGLDADGRKQVGEMMNSLKGQKPEAIHNTLLALRQQYPALTPYIDFFGKHFIAPAVGTGSQDAIDKSLDSAMRFTLSAEQQKPSIAMVPTKEGTQPYNVNAQTPGGIGPMGAPLTPPNQLASDTSGGTQIVNPTEGVARPIVPAAPVKAAPAAPVANPMSFPGGETAQTQQELQGQRTAAQAASNMAPQMRNINRGIIGEVDKGVTTGRLGGFINNLKSLTGFQVGEEGASDYNLLGKYLERSALQASQAMGPHTNAGLEAQVRANGSAEYTPQALRKIAVLNDALTTGSQLYQKGLEQSIQGGGNVFAKRQFDQQWSQAMSPAKGFGNVDGVLALRLKNAVDAGDKKDIAEITRAIGGPKSDGARALHQKLGELNRLTGQ